MRGTFNQWLFARPKRHKNKTTTMFYGCSTRPSTAELKSGNRNRVEERFCCGLYILLTHEAFAHQKGLGAVT